MVTVASAVISLEQEISSKINIKETAEVSGDTSAVNQAGAGLDEKAGEIEEREFPDFGAQYRVLGEVGQGGMGAVYRVEELSSGKIFAIKTLGVDLVNDLAARKRFEQEAAAASQLDHANLAAVYKHGCTADGVPFIVMDYLQGKSLADVISEAGAMEPGRALTLFSQIADALAYAHEHGVVHRDVKPTNVIITESASGEVAHLVDFGISMVTPTSGRETLDLTKTGEVFGSPQYMSPEQCLGFMLDERSDVYSFGCMMYEALVGKPPFAGTNPVQLVVKHINDDPPSIPREFKVNATVEKLERIILRCMEKEQALRFQTVSELRQVLDLVREGKAVPKYVRGAKSRPTLTRRQAIGAVAVFCLVVLGICAVLSFFDVSYVFTNLVGATVWAMICVGGAYAFLSTALDRLRALPEKKGTPRQWAFIYGVAFLGSFAVLMSPCASSMVSYYFSLPDWLDLIGPACAVLAGVSITLAVVFGIGYFLLRSSKRVGALYAPARMVPVAILLTVAFVCVFPERSGDALVWLAEGVNSTLPGVSEDLCRFAIGVDRDKKSERAMSHCRALVTLQGASGDARGAIKTMDEIIAREGSNSQNLITRGRLYLKTGQLDKAEADFLAGSAKTGDSSPFLQLGQLRAIKGDLSSALSYFERSLELDPSSRNPAYKSRIGSYFDAGDYDKAFSELDKLSKMGGEEIAAHLMRGVIYEQLGRVSEARREFKFVVDHIEELGRPDSYASFQNNLMVAYAASRLGDSGVAERYMRECRRAGFGSLRGMEDRLAEELGLQYSKLKFLW